MTWTPPRLKFSLGLLLFYRKVFLSSISWSPIISASFNFSKNLFKFRIFYEISTKKYTKYILCKIIILNRVQLNSLNSLLILIFRSCIFSLYSLMFFTFYLWFLFSFYYNLCSGNFHCKKRTKHLLKRKKEKKIVKKNRNGKLYSFNERKEEEEEDDEEEGRNE